MIVAPLTKEDANELYMIIGTLEGIAGRGVAALPTAKRTELSAQLRKLNERLLQICEGRAENKGRSSIWTEIFIGSSCITAQAPAC